MVVVNLMDVPRSVPLLEMGVIRFVYSSPTKGLDVFVSGITSRVIVSDVPGSSGMEV